MKSSVLKHLAMTYILSGGINNFNQHRYVLICVKALFIYFVFNALKKNYNFTTLA